MKLSRTAFLSSLICMATLGSEKFASANTWNINGETVNLSEEINKARSAGRLTKEEAAELNNQELKITRQEAGMRQRHRGNLLPHDQSKIQRELCDLYSRLKRQEAMSPDDTGRNLGDARHSSVTAQTQSSTRQDLRITQQIRQELVSDPTLSSDAKNIKIVTSGGMVTLRGPVDNERERRRVIERARKYVGVDKVNSELTVARR